MGSPYPRPSWLRRQAKRHPAILVVGVICAAVVLLEVGAVTGFFGLSALKSSPKSPAPPDLNPYGEVIVEVVSHVNYTGAGSGYFAELEGQNLCGAAGCNALTYYPAYSPPEIGFFFYFNVTNTAAHDENISQPKLGVSGPDHEIFLLVTFCCYTTESKPYSEPLTDGAKFEPNGENGSTIGLRGYIYATDPIPQSPSGTYDLYFNVTSN